MWWKTRFLPLRDLPDVLAAISPMDVCHRADTMLHQKVTNFVATASAPYNQSVVIEEESCFRLVFGVKRKHLRVRIKF